MNIVILKGNLVRDPEVKEIPMGTDRAVVVANFTIAVSRYYKKKDGETEQVTEYIDCEAWDSGATTIGKILHKGDPVLINGSLKKESWETKEGEKRSRTKVRVREFDKLARFVKLEGGPPVSDDAPEPVAAATNDAGGDDIPF